MFSVYDFDRFSRHDQIGEVKIALNSIDLGKVIRELKDLSPPPGDKEAVSLSARRFCSSLIIVRHLGEQIRRHLLFATICSDSWQIDSDDTRSEESEEDGRRWSIR